MSKEKNENLLTWSKSIRTLAMVPMIFVFSPINISHAINAIFPDWPMFVC